MEIGHFKIRFNHLATWNEVGFFAAHSFCAYRKSEEYGRTLKIVSS